MSDSFNELPSLAPLSLRSLNAASELHTAACNPTMDLVALPSQEAKFSLWRMSGQVAKAWERTTDGAVDDLCWSPDGQSSPALVAHVTGQLIALGLDERIVLHSLHQGSPLPFRIPLIRSDAYRASDAENEPPNKRRKVHCLSWSAFEWQSEALPHFSSAGQILERLPQLNTPAKDSKQASGAFSATSALTPLGGASGPPKTSSEIARANFAKIAAALPILPPQTASATASDPTLLRPKARRPVNARDTVLLATLTGSSRIHVLLGGSVSLGAIELPSGSTALAADVLDRDMSKGDPALFIAILYSLESKLYHRIYALSSLPSASLERIVRTSSSIYSHLSHALVALEDARKVWVEAQAQWQQWLEKLAEEHDGSKTAKLNEARAMLMRYVTTGRATPAMREYFGSKNNERAFAKIEQSMSAALGQLGMLSMHHLGPVLERSIVRLEEMLGYALWKDKMDPLLQLDPAIIRLAISLASDLYRRVIDFDMALRQEWAAWPEVRKWIRVELERTASLGNAAVAHANMTPAQRARDREREKNMKPHPILFAHDAVVVATYLDDNGKNAAAISMALELDVGATHSPWIDELPCEPEVTASRPPTLAEVQAALGDGPTLSPPRDGTQLVGDSLGHWFAEIARTLGIAFGHPLARIAKSAEPVAEAHELFAISAEAITRSRAVSRSSSPV